MLAAHGVPVAHWIGPCADLVLDTTMPGDPGQDDWSRSAQQRGLAQPGAVMVLAELGAVRPARRSRQRHK
jgi:hypothetical protein